MSKRSRFGVRYSVRATLAKLPVPDHGLTKKEAAKLKDLELAFTDYAHKLGVHFSITLRFPRAIKEGGGT